VNHSLNSTNQTNQGGTAAPQAEPDLPVADLMEDYEVFNNFAYQNIPSQRPDQPFGAAENPIEKQNRELFQHSVQSNMQS